MLLRFRILEQGAVRTLIRLEGALDDGIAPVLAQLEAVAKTKELALDVGGIERITSLGVKGWISGMDRLDVRSKVSFVNCPSAFVDMGVMLPSFVKGRKVESFYAPFECESCNIGQSVLVTVTSGKMSALPKIVCKTCGEAMAVDEDFVAEAETILTA